MNIQKRDDFKLISIQGSNFNLPEIPQNILMGTGTSFDISELLKKTPQWVTQILEKNN